MALGVKINVSLLGENVTTLIQYFYTVIMYPPYKCFYFTGHRTAYNWLTGSSMETLAEYTIGSESLSSLLVFEKKDERRLRARRPVGEGFGIKHLTATSEDLKSQTKG